MRSWTSCLKGVYCGAAALSWRGVLAVALLLCPIGLAVTSADTPRDLCNAGETTVFSCSVQDDKLVSLCASPDLSRDTGYLQYRYGHDAGSIEMRYPRHTDRPGAFKYLQEYAARGGTSALSFRVGRYRYSLFSTTSAYGFNGAGVIVDRGHKRVAYLRCDDKSIIIQSDRFYQLSSLGFPDARGDVSYIGADAQQ